MHHHQHNQLLNAIIITMFVDSTKDKSILNENINLICTPGIS